jgi:Family of unknown function (DUF6585)
MRNEPLVGAALRTFAVSLAWELSDLAVAGRVHGAVDPDHVVCGGDGVATLISPPTVARSASVSESPTAATDVAGWGQTVTFAATRRAPPLGSVPDLQDVGLARVIARTIVVEPPDRPDATELKLLLAELEVTRGADWGPEPEDAANFLAAFALFAAMRREEQAIGLPGLRAGVPSDLLHAPALGAVVRVFPTHMRFWAMLAGVGFATGVGLFIAGLRANDPVAWSPGLVLVLVGLAILPWLVRSWGMAAVVFDHGFGLKRRSHRWVARWEDVTRLRVDVRRKPKASYATVQVFGLLADGARFHVPRSVFGRQTLVCASVLERHTFLPRLTAAQAELKRGQRDFGAVRLTRAGIEYGNRTIPWHELSRVVRVPYNALGAAATAIAIIGRDARGQTVTFTVPEYRLWDARVLLAILEASQQTSAG